MQRSSCGVQGINLYYDNEQPHVHRDVSNYLQCDFWLFDFIKQNLADQNNSESLYRATSNFMNSLDKEEYIKKFDEIKEIRKKKRKKE